MWYRREVHVATVTKKQLYYRAVCLAFRLATELIFLFSLLGHFSMTFRKSCAMSEADQ